MKTETMQNMMESADCLRDAIARAYRESNPVDEIVTLEILTDFSEIQNRIKRLADAVRAAATLNNASATPAPSSDEPGNVNADLLKIAEAYLNHLRFSASTEGEVATFAHIESVVQAAKAGNPAPSSTVERESVTFSRAANVMVPRDLWNEFNQHFEFATESSAGGWIEAGDFSNQAEAAAEGGETPTPAMSEWLLKIHASLLKFDGDICFFRE